MSKKTASASGKIILSGEYAVVFGYPGIAVPANVTVDVTWEDSEKSPMDIRLEGLTGEEQYARRIVDLCVKEGGPDTGTLRIVNSIPVGRGMGSSTALVVGICKCLLEDERAKALMIEDTVNPGNSGLDFAVIWANCPLEFTKGMPSKPVTLSLDFLKHSTLIDTGKPGEFTKDLVAWMRTRADEPDVATALKTIGHCTERLIAGEDLKTVIRDHHRAQVTLGVVTPEAQKIIADIEKTGGAAKVLGAGARTGGGGIILALRR